MNCSTDQPFERLQCRPEVKNAIITSDGELTPNFKYIADLRRDQRYLSITIGFVKRIFLSNRSAHKAKVMAGDARRVLLLGAGMVSDPLAHYYSLHSDVLLTVATDSPKDGKRLAQIGNNIESIVLDVVKEPEVIDQMVGEHDLVVSLLPFNFHPSIVKLCIKHKKNMVTCSYITPELQALDEA